jgi:putative endonuclease
VSGVTGYFGGQAAEDSVAARYADLGYQVAARRWRGAGGEIDLVLRDAGTVICVEVKRSASHEAALQRLGPRQVARIMAAAAEFIGGEPAGQLTDLRFDLATVDGSGTVRVLENAFGQG